MSALAAQRHTRCLHAARAAPWHRRARTQQSSGPGSCGALSAASPAATAAPPEPRPALSAATLARCSAAMSSGMPHSRRAAAGPGGVKRRSAARTAAISHAPSTASEPAGCYPRRSIACGTLSRTKERARGRPRHDSSARHRSSLSRFSRSLQPAGAGLPRGIKKYPSARGIFRCAAPERSAPCPRAAKDKRSRVQHPVATSVLSGSPRGAVFRLAMPHLEGSPGACTSRPRRQKHVQPERTGASYKRAARQAERSSARAAVPEPRDALGGTSSDEGVFSGLHRHNSIGRVQRALQRSSRHASLAASSHDPSQAIYPNFTPRDALLARRGASEAFTLQLSSRAISWRMVLKLGLRVAKTLVCWLPKVQLRRMAGRRRKSTRNQTRPAKLKWYRHPAQSAARALGKLARGGSPAWGSTGCCRA